jgi:prophage regulatory protein
MADIEDRVLKPATVIDRVGLSRVTIWRMVRRGEFPAPARLSPGRIGWSAHAVNAWVAERMAAAA